MTVLTRLDRSDASLPSRCGGKAAGLASLRAAGLPAPESYCLPVKIYLDFVTGSGLAEIIAYELGRKDFGTMRWEELWDAALRLRRHFVTAPWPAGLEAQLRRELDAAIAGWQAAAVRSSAAGEDGSAHSFAGLHDSRIMLRTTDQILAAVRVVWASLWSDGALLYRRELGLDPERSGMAVVIQEMIVGECSGVLFSASPRDRGCMMVEAVWGLNQALVDGSLAPWRWELGRETGRPVRFEAVEQSTALQPAVTGTALVPLPPQQAGRPPLAEALLARLAELGRRAEQLVGGPADVEWTCRQGEFVLLQVRPITTGTDEADPRRWYLSLHRSLESLELLREELEEEVLPGMQAAAAQMAAVDLASQEDAVLAEELTSRYRSLDEWTDVYHDKCIPMAHGIRLFGEYYTDRIQPDDPYAFVDLLRSAPLLAVERNRRMLELAAILKRDRKLLRDLRESGRLPEHGAFAEQCRELIREFGDLDWVSSAGLFLAGWLLRLAESGPDPQPERKGGSSVLAEADFLALLDQEERPLARRLLAVGRASYALRDNDNFYLGRIRAQVYAAEAEVRRRTERTGTQGFAGLLREDSMTEVVAVRPGPGGALPDEIGGRQARARQLVGQPAVAGVVRASARVLQRGAELSTFQPGEVLVCDAIEPNMTFLVPVAAAIVERRGGMLIHGAIIAREYGIPCVTGVPAATTCINSGDSLTVDGYLGIVTIDRPVD